MIRDILVVVIMLFVIGIGIAIISYTFTNLNDAIQGEDSISATAKDNINERASNFNTVWDYTFLTILIAVLVGALILSWYLKTNPALFFVVLLVIVLFGIIAGALANGWEEVAAEEGLSATFDSLPITNFIMSNYLIFIVIIAFLMLFVFFAKPGDDGVGY